MCSKNLIGERYVGCRPEGEECPDCKVWTCVRHNWLGDDKKQYCETCVKNHRGSTFKRMNPDFWDK